MPIKTLMEFGLTEKEAKIYVALLQLEVAKISEIAQKSGINRSSAYMILEELKKKELVSVSAGEHEAQKYVATSPEILLRQADEKERAQKAIREKIEKLLPELKAVHKDTKVRPKVYVYTGAEAIKQGYSLIYNEQVRRGMKKFRVFEDFSQIKNKLPANFVEDDVSDIKKSGAKMYLIAPDNTGSKSMINEYKRFGSEDNFAIIPSKEFNRTKRPVRAFGIYEDKISFITKDSFLVVVESLEIADALKNIFDLAWKEATRLNTSSKK